jgi:hypothetical protein
MSTVVRSIEFLVLSIVVLIPIWLMGFTLFSFWPDVRVTDMGIRYRFGGGLFKDEIMWSEIKELYKFTSKKMFNEYVVILIQRKKRGVFWPKKLLLQSIHAQIVDADLPVLMLSPRLINRDRVVDSITNNTNILLEEL